MPVMGFDDERGRDAWQAEMDARRAAAAGPSWEELLREVLQEIELREGERGDALAALEEWRRAAEVFARAVAEVVRRPLEALVEAALLLGEGVAVLWEASVNLGEEELRRGAGRAARARGDGVCLPVARVDPVRAGRSRWWTRK